VRIVASGSPGWIGPKYEFKFERERGPLEDYLGNTRLVHLTADRKSRLLMPAKLVIDFVNKDGKREFTFNSPGARQDEPDTSLSLAEARKGFKTKLVRTERGGRPAPEPPPDVFRLVRYEAPPGKLAAYLTPDPEDGKKHPAIIWVTGGDCNTIGQACWQEGRRQDDQSAGQYRKAGIVMMFPSLRGGNDNPGVKEGMLGEVDDVLAAADYLARQEFVDPQRIYLGGHSTGGTLVLLVAECSDRFRAVFSFGPVDNMDHYGPEHKPFAMFEAKELFLRSPGRWLHSIRGRVFVFEGVPGNQKALQAMARSCENPLVQFVEVKGYNHFALLAPTNRLIAERILEDTGPTCNLAFTAEELSKPRNQGL
jgi:hypothetical protein